MIAARLLRISGIVQGVWYRASMAEAANRLGVRGWARNRADGTVEALAIGSATQLDALIEWAQRGPPKARVTDVQVRSVEPPDPLPTDFSVAPDA